MPGANKVPRHLRLEHVLFDAPKVLSGGGAWLRNPLNRLDVSGDAAWVVGKGIILRIDLNSSTVSNVSWNVAGDTAFAGSNIDDVEPIVYEFEPRFLKAFSSSACRVLGWSDGEIAMWETRDTGASWDRIPIGPCEDADDLYAAAVLPSGEVRLVTVSESGVATASAVTPFGEQSKLFEWDFDCIRGGGHKLLFVDNDIGYITLGTQDLAHPRAYSKIYETVNSGTSWRCIGEFSLDSVVGFGPGGTLWIGDERGFVHRRVGEGWVGDRISPTLDICSMGLGGPGPPLLMNDNGVGYVYLKDRWFLIETDQELYDYWLQIAWLTTRRLLVLSTDRLCTVELK